MTETTAKRQEHGARLGHGVTLKEMKGHHLYKWRATFVEGGKYKSKGFKSENAAKEWKKKRVAEARAHGTDSALTSAERSTVLDTRAKLEEVGLSLRDAVTFAVEYRRRAIRSCTMTELVADAITSRKGAGRSEVHIKGMEGRLGRFNETFGARSVATISTQEIEDWLHALELSPSSVNSYRRMLVLVFNDAIKKKFTDENPAAKVIRSKEVQTETGIVSPPEAVRLLHGASSAILPVIAIGLFTGLRDSEIKRLDWADVRLDLGHVRVRAAKAKGARKRTISISENLREWLTPIAKASGPVWPPNGKKLMEAARRSAGFGAPKEVAKSLETHAMNPEKAILTKWPENALRHSFATYHVRFHKNSDALALEMGHTNTALIFAHYLNGDATEEEAAAFWNIRPQAPPKATSALYADQTASPS